MNPFTTTRDVFLCHASEDKPSVKSISLGLQRYGITTWLDEAEMRPGDILVEKISQAIDKADHLCAFLTPNSIKKDWVRFELNQAMHKEVTEGHSFVIPVLLHDCQLPPYLRPKIYVDLRNWDKFGQALESLAIAIKGDIYKLPGDFTFDGLNSKVISEEKLVELTNSQAVLEMKLRFDRWNSRKLATLRNYSQLTLKQVITYCEEAPHIIIAPHFNTIGEIFYGLKWRVMSDYHNSTHFSNNLTRYLTILSRSSSTSNYPSEIIEYFLSFYDTFQNNYKI